MPCQKKITINTSDRISNDGELFVYGSAELHLQCLMFHSLLVLELVYFAVCVGCILTLWQFVHILYAVSLPRVFLALYFHIMLNLKTS